MSAAISAVSVLPLTAAVSSSISRGRWLCAISAVLLIHAALQAMQCQSAADAHICGDTAHCIATQSALLHSPWTERLMHWQILRNEQLRAVDGAGCHTMHAAKPSGRRI